jgi:hypothetical protein
VRDSQIALRRERKRLRRKRKIRARAQTARNFLDGAVRLTAPDEFKLEPRFDYDRVVNFVSKLKHCVITKQRIVLNFRQVELFSPAATLLFHANVVALLGLSGIGRVRALMPRRNRVHQVLAHLGFCKMFRAPIINVNRKDVVRWHSVTGDTVDTEQAGTVLEKILPRKIAGKMYRCVSEAITNAIQHSQIDSSVAVRWSMFASCDEHRMIIALCDLGIGIPRSLPRKTVGEQLNSLLTIFGNQRDSSFINAAIEISRTRTGKDHRGKGLADIISLAAKIDGAIVYIFSNSGCVKVESRNNTVKRTQIDHSNSVCGTLITWVLPLDNIELERENEHSSP